MKHTRITTILVAAAALLFLQAASADAKTLAETDTYIITLADAGSASANSKSSVTVTVTPKKGWKLNKDFPTKLTIEPPSGVTVDKKKLKKKDAASFSEKKAAWKVQFKSGSGTKKFMGQLKFAVCTDATCDPKREKLEWNVTVK